jgi:hypothetical protein
VKNLINTLELPSISSSSSSTTPIQSLHSGNWVKLICGASFEDVVDIRNLSLVYTLAGGNYNNLFPNYYNLFENIWCVDINSG